MTPAAFPRRSNDPVQRYQITDEISDCRRAEDVPFGSMGYESSGSKDYAQPQRSPSGRGCTRPSIAEMTSATKIVDGLRASR